MFRKFLLLAGLFLAGAAQAADVNWDAYNNTAITQASDEFLLYRPGTGLRNWLPTYLQIDADGDITGPKDLTITGNLSALNFSGSSSGANTGDQTLASLGLATGCADNTIIRADGTGGGTQCSNAYLDDFSGSNEILRIVAGADNNSAGFYLSNDPANPNTSANSDFGILADESRSQVVFFARSGVDRSFIFTEIGNRQKNHDHTTQTNPTIFVHSATDPDSDNTEWISFTHDQTNAVISTGSGDLSLTPATGTVTATTFVGAFTGNSSTATALAADPANCVTSTHFAVGINASGVPDCEAIADADVPNTITVDLAAAASALNANGSNASSGNAILGVDAQGNAEGAFDVWTEAENTAAAYAPIASPVFTGIVTLPSAASPTTDADGEIAVDLDGWASGYDLYEIFNGTRSAGIVSVPVADTCTNGQVPKYTDGEFLCEDDADSGGSTAWDAIGDPSGDGTVAFAGTTQTLTGNTNDVTAIDQDLLKLSFTNDAATDILTQRGLFIQNEASANGMEALIALNNNDADDVVTSGIIINSAAGAITNAIDVSDADIGNALIIGANPLATGNVAGTIGDATTDSWTFVTDSTGNGEIVLPDASIQAAELGTDSVSADELNAAGVETELEAVLDLDQLQGQIADGQIADGAVDGGAGGEIADASITADDLGADSVSSSELNAAGVEAELEAVIDLQDLQGAATDAQVPNTITIDLAAAATALAADPANCVTSTHFAVGINASGVPDCEAIGDADIPDNATVTGWALGTIASGTGTALTALDGENIQNDTIDDDSIDFADVTGADLTLTDAVAVTTSGKIISNANLDVKNGATSSGVFAIFEDSDAGTNKATFQVPSLAGDTVYTLPADDGDAGEQLQSDGAGVLTWEAASGVASTITVADTTDSTSFCALFESATGNLAPKTDGGCLYAADTGTLAATVFSTATVTLTGTGTINGLDAVDATGEDTVEALIFDADAQNVTAVWEWQDDIDMVFGNDANWAIQYDEGVDDQLLFVTAGTAAIATTDPMFEILVGANPTANQQVFGVAKGTQSSNTALFTVDEDGDGIFTGTLNLTGALTFGGTGALDDVDQINSTTESTIEAAMDTLTNVTSVGTLTGGATGAGFTVALGTSTITGTLPAANGGGRVLLATGTASNSTSIDFTSGLTSTYDIYEIDFHNIIPATDGGNLQILTDSNAGASFDTGASDYKYVTNNMNSGTGTATVIQSNAAAQIYVFLSSGSTAGESVNGKIRIYNPSGTAAHKIVEFVAAGIEEDATLRHQSGAGARAATAAINALRLSMDVGNITSGTFQLYGVIK